MTISDIFDWIARASAAVGLPGVAIYYVRDRRQKNAEARRAEAAADLDEQTTPDRAKTSSIATIEAEMVAMQRAFETSRAADAQTIARLEGSLEAERKASDAKDRRIGDLESKVAELKTRLAELSDELAHVSDELRLLHDREPGAV
ncbi:hypothetical protein [Phycicoccus jejuensis]|uniref:hypothetical protein n=1 Tax=Phycicoccus jejuensis TaxID=367299 RepID=UPI0004C2E6A2|nr:hypothetical protein [Phycicoccus jejuensis]